MLSILLVNKTQSSNTHTHTNFLKNTGFSWIFIYFHGFSHMFMGFSKMFHRNNPPTDPDASPGQVTTEVLLRDVDTILVDGALILRQARKTTCAFRLKILYTYTIYICIHIYMTARERSQQPKKIHIYICIWYIIVYYIYMYIIVSIYSIYIHGIGKLAQGVGIPIVGHLLPVPDTLQARRPGLVSQKFELKQFSISMSARIDGDKRTTINVYQRRT